jgi:transcription elongation factor Elf1
MFESLFSKQAEGILKALTLEWSCPKCDGRNFRILSVKDRMAGEYHSKCRYCRAKCQVSFPPQADPVIGEAEFRDRIQDEDFTPEEQLDMIRDFAEIASLVVDNALPGVIQEKKKALEAKITFAKRRRR